MTALVFNHLVLAFFAPRGSLAEPPAADAASVAASDAPAVSPASSAPVQIDTASPASTPRDARTRRRDRRSADPTRPRGKRAFDVQLDPTPSFLRGFAPEVGLTLGRHRMLATIIQYDVPAFLAEDDRFDERRNALLALGYEVFWLRHMDGPFVGLTFSATYSTFTLEATSSAHDTWTSRSTLRLGWMVAPFRAAPGFFLAPWVGFNVTLAADTFEIDGVTIERGRIGPTGALQIGYRFDLRRRRSRAHENH